MHFTEDPHLPWMIVSWAVLTAGALLSFLYVCRLPRRRRPKDNETDHDRAP